MIRIPNSYGTRTIVVQNNLNCVVMDNNEIMQFMSGQKAELSKDAEERMRSAFSSQDKRTKLFLAAVAQKSMSRFARLMQAMEHVDDEVLKPWRIQSMNTNELLTLFSELNIEKNRSLKELYQINDIGLGNVDKMIPARNPLSNLDEESQERVRNFMRVKVVSNECNDSSNDS